jgi:hypothetical protein
MFWFPNTWPDVSEIIAERGYARVSTRTDRARGTVAYETAEAMGRHACFSLTRTADGKARWLRRAPERTKPFDPVTCLPSVLAAGYDPHHHRVPADFISLAQTELDLANEGEVTLTRRQRAQIEQYLSQLRALA